MYHLKRDGKFMCMNYNQYRKYINSNPREVRYNYILFSDREKSRLNYCCPGCLNKAKITLE